MPTLANDVNPPRTEPTRREFLKAGGLAGASFACSQWNARALASPSDERAVILLMLVGGPSQLETWDPKPDAPAEIRGPFASIATRIPGIRIGEHLPRSARRIDRALLVRSLHHDSAPIHETGHQLIQTGRLCRQGAEFPHLGAVASHLLGSRPGVPASVILPAKVANTGIAISHGQSAGFLGPAHEPYGPSLFPAVLLANDAGLTSDGKVRLDIVRDSYSSRFWNAYNIRTEPEAVRTAYGNGQFGHCCLVARRLVDAGVRVVTVNMDTTVFNTVGWDCHGSGPFSTLADYRDRVLPRFDRAFSALLDDLEQRGRLESTLVVATGEFGRTPKLNAAGGRDHWPGV